jgi:UDP-N-acetylglucosamine:LPS N-acetylglucosamine transferase
MKTIIISTGGTGGHIFPAQAVAKKLSERGFRTIIFGDKNYPKYHKPDSPYKSKIISSSQLSKSPLSLFKAGFKISFGIFQSMFWLLKYQPEAVVAFGGYATFPILVAAVILKRKIILHEQNAHLGKVNRMFAKYADKIALSYEETDGLERKKNSEQLFLAKGGIGESQSRDGNTMNSSPKGGIGESQSRDGNTMNSSPKGGIGESQSLDGNAMNSSPKGGIGESQSLDGNAMSPSPNGSRHLTLPQGEGNKYIFTGNPIREEIVALSKNEYQLPDFNQQIQEPDNLGYDVLLASEFYNLKHQKNKPTFNILVLGGSGGAKIFSEILPKAFFNLREEIKNDLAITMQCRADYLHNTFEQYKSFNISIVINSFFTDIDEQIKKSHLVIARSGSSSLAEFACAKRPMILVPFALAADNHQEKNARQIEKIGGAIVIKEQDFTINNITSAVEKLFDNPSLLQKMSSNAFKCAHLEATDNLVELIIKL